MCEKLKIYISYLCLFGNDFFLKYIKKIIKSYIYFLQKKTFTVIKKSKIFIFPIILHLKKKI